MAAAGRSVLAVDGGKFGRTATYAHGDLSGYGTLITDDNAPRDQLRAAEKRGIEVRAVATG